MSAQNGATPHPKTYDYSDPKLECDIIMKGGVTSGVIYPWAVCELARTYRFRCVGCDHFRTDVSFLPDLQAHLDDLLRNRERLVAATDVDDWARAEAMPSTEEITRIRRLIHRITTELDTLTSDDRHQIEQAVATVRRTRTVTLGIPRLRQPLPDVRPQKGTA